MRDQTKIPEPESDHAPWPFLTRDQYREAVAVGALVFGVTGAMYVVAMGFSWLLMRGI